MSARLLFLLAFLVVLHLLLNVGLSLGPMAPDLLVVAVVTGSQRFGGAWGAALGFALGLVEDGTSISNFGANVFALTVVGGLAGRIANALEGDSTTFLLAFLAVGKWSRDILAWVVSDSATRPPVVDALLVESPLAALYAAVAGVAARALMLPRSRASL